MPSELYHPGRYENRILNRDPIDSNRLPLVGMQGCQVGLSYNEHSLACEKCAAGFYGILGNGEANRLASCIACPPGTVQPDTGRTNCSACPKGRFENLDGNVCIDCPPGAYASGEGAEFLYFLGW